MWQWSKIDRAYSEHRRLVDALEDTSSKVLRIFAELLPVVSSPAEPARRSSNMLV